MEIVQSATSNPARAATRERSRHSVANCCVSLARVAPSAERMDSSAARSAVPAISRFATFVQAINRISATPAISIREAFFAGAGRVVEPGRRDPDDGERLAIDSDGGTQGLPVSREKLL